MKDSSKLKTQRWYPNCHFWELVIGNFFPAGGWPWKVEGDGWGTT